MTLREEVMKNSGLLTEEILEEGLLKKALLIAGTIAALSGALIGGPKVAKEVKQYKSVKDIPVATRFEKAEAETNKDIAGKEYLVGTMYDKMKFVKKIHADYNDRNNQAVIYIDLGKDADSYPSLTTGELRNALRDYVSHLNEYSSKIEDKFGDTEFNKVPLKVVVRFTRGDKAPSDDFYFETASVIRDITGVTGSNVAYEVKRN